MSPLSREVSRIVKDAARDRGYLDAMACAHAPGITLAYKRVLALLKGRSAWTLPELEEFAAFLSTSVHSLIEAAESGTQVEASHGFVGATGRTSEGTVAVFESRRRSVSAARKTPLLADVADEDPPRRN